MIRSTWVILSLLASLPLAAADWKELKREALARRPALRAAASATGAKTLTVDCTKGESVQAAIDKSASPVEIDIHGLCVETVVIDAKEVTLRGASPATDGIQSPSSATAVQIIDSHPSRLENLSLSNNPGRAVVMTRSTVTMNNCTVSGNNATPGTGQAVAVFSDSLLDATAVTASSNVRRVFVVSGNSGFFCHGCDFSGNATFVAMSTRGSILSLLNSTVTGPAGILSTTDSYADIDCISEVSAHPCSMQATLTAARVDLGGTVALYGAGDFTGSVQAHDRGGAHLFGARQIASSQPNGVDSFATMQVYANPPVESRILTTHVNGFGRLLIIDASEFSGAIQCASAGDAFLAATVVTAPGSTVTGCDHAP